MTDLVPWQEPAIVINGHALSTGQAMTLRVALELYLMQLSELPDADRGVTEHNYLARGREVIRFMQDMPEESPR